MATERQWIGLIGLDYNWVADVSRELKEDNESLLEALQMMTERLDAIVREEDSTLGSRSSDERTRN